MTAHVEKSVCDLGKRVVDRDDPEVFVQLKVHRLGRVTWLIVRTPALAAERSLADQRVIRLEPNRGSAMKLTTSNCSATACIFELALDADQQFALGAAKTLGIGMTLPSGKVRYDIPIDGYASAADSLKVEDP